MLQFLSCGHKCSQRLTINKGFCTVISLISCQLIHRFIYSMRALWPCNSHEKTPNVTEGTNWPVKQYYTSLITLINEAIVSYI